MSKNALEPKDWDAFRAEARALLDDCIDMMQAADRSPWIHPPSDLQETYEIGRGGDLMARLRDESPDFFRQLRSDVCLIYLSDPGVWQRIGFPGESVETGGYPDFDQPQHRIVNDPETPQ